jgi:hypothetical protein
MGYVCKNCKTVVHARCRKKGKDLLCNRDSLKRQHRIDNVSDCWDFSDIVPLIKDPVHGILKNHTDASSFSGVRIKNWLEQVFPASTSADISEAIQKLEQSSYIKQVADPLSFSPDERFFFFTQVERLESSVGKITGSKIMMETSFLLSKKCGKAIMRLRLPIKCFDS